MVATIGAMMAVGLILGILELIPILGIFFALVRFAIQTALGIFLAVYQPALTITYLYENGLEKPIDET
jgi:hypothetical protein